jgi:hypothetical protein
MEFVSKNYKMNPETEYKLDSGLSLADGQIVLVASPFARSDAEGITPESWDYKMALLRNRWGRVSNFRVIPLSPSDVLDMGYGEHNPHRMHALIGFTKVFQDGTTLNETLCECYQWLVKRAPIEGL